MNLDLYRSPELLGGSSMMPENNEDQDEIPDEEEALWEECVASSVKILIMEPRVVAPWTRVLDDSALVRLWHIIL